MAALYAKRLDYIILIKPFYVPQCHSVLLFAKKLSEVLNTPFIPNKGKQKYLKEKPKYLMDTSHYGSEKQELKDQKL